MAPNLWRDCPTLVVATAALVVAMLATGFIALQPLDRTVLGIEPVSWIVAAGMVAGGGFMLLPGTLPYLAGRLDLFYNKRIPPEERKIAELPSEHLRRIYYDSITFHPLALQLLIDVGGADKVMFGTDYPHPADIPFLRGIVEDLPADQAKAVLGENARRVFGF